MSTDNNLNGNVLQKSAPKPSKATSQLRLTERDAAIFAFLYDQKFATLEAIYFKFFDRRATPSEPLPPNLFVTRQRLGLLQKAGFLVSDRVFSESKSLYLLGLNGFKTLQRAGQTYGPRFTTVNFATYLHDLKVTYCRIALERQGKAVSWYSERCIRLKGFDVSGVLKRHLHDSVIPDAIFVSSKGERVAFELQSTERDNTRFEHKMQEYQGLIRSQLIHRVLWVASGDKAARDLLAVAGGRANFMVDRYETFTNQLLPGIKL